MSAISVIIIGKNVAATLQAAIKSARLLTDDIIYVDSGSTDSSIAIADSGGAKVISINWKGFGNARNTGAEHAAHDFICNIDADEVITPELAQHILATTLDAKFIYGFKRRNFFDKHELKYGEWGNDEVYRIYHRKIAKWNLDDVHEMIESEEGKKKILPGALLHYTTDNLHRYYIKLEKYAALSAQKFYRQGKKAGFVKKYLSPFFGFVKNYFFFRGFLDGKNGWRLAKAHGRYTKLKYRKLAELWEGGRES